MDSKAVGWMRLMAAALEAPVPVVTGVSLLP